MLREYEFSDRLMGCDFHISLICHDQTQAHTIYTDLLKLGHDFEHTFSRFRLDSELTQLNINGTLLASRRFLDVFLLAKKLHSLTEGRFNPLTQVHTLGYTVTFEQMSSSSPQSSPTNYSTSFANVHVDQKTRKITLRKDQQIDVAGFLKGHVAQIFAEHVMTNKNIQGTVINIGGDICTRGTDENNEVFLFNVYNPYSKKDLCDIPLHNQSLSTSGTYKRQWLVGSVLTHHIIDSSTKNNPDTDLVSASVISNDGAYSDAFATTAIILGSEKAPTFLQKNHVQYILITKNGIIIKN